ncbi:MAG: pilin [bacterium]|nr:pilin [bacterium]
MNAEFRMSLIKKYSPFLIVFFILNSAFFIPAPAANAQGGILPTPGETCADDECRQLICPQSPIPRICEEGKCIVNAQGQPRGIAAQETLPCNYTLDDMVLTGINMSKFIFGITGSLMLMFIVYGGYQLFASVGNPEGIMAGRKTLTAAFIGVILIFGASILVRFIAGLILPAPGPRVTTIPVPAGGALPKIEVR